MPSAFYHIITILLIWLSVLIISQLTKVGILRGINVLDVGGREYKSKVGKVVKIINISATVSALSIIVLVIFFLSSPLQRSYEEIRTIEKAVVDEEFEAPTKEEIEIQNKEVIESRHKAKKKEAEEDNIRAMEEASGIFGRVAKEADARNGK